MVLAATLEACPDIIDPLSNVKAQLEGWQPINELPYNMVWHALQADFAVVTITEVRKAILWSLQKTWRLPRATATSNLWCHSVVIYSRLTDYLLVVPTCGALLYETQLRASQGQLLLIRAHICNVLL